MTLRSTFPLQADTDLPMLPFPDVRQAVLAMAQEHELPVVEASAAAVTVEIAGFGHYRFAARNGGTAIGVSAALPDRLHMLKDGIAAHLDEIRPGASAALRWPGAAAAGSLPPNVHFTTVQSITPIGSAFLRVRIKAPDLAGFQDDAIHFRLLLPPAGCAAPQWPRLSETGATVWPKGETALHRPVYTTRWISHAAGLMDFDIFLHDGGRATEWARNATHGDQLVLAGPGGGGIPDTSSILLFADETALPAAARILDSLPRDSAGEAVLLSSEGKDCGYPVTAPAGVSLTWLRRDGGHSLAERALAARKRAPGHFLWFACEKAEVQRLRAALQRDKPAPGTSYIAAYWSQS
ncbi:MULTISPECIES: siderophore-interacting protein [Leisingera]|uniref:siderophore-interacting protein n=1 Tax=Leisingera TaxID=191028 RepID=UPI001151D857|nr:MULTISPECIES: siderophore-interacting protein [Leisingera]QDI74304.1 siderophore-interacting protein [Leisingera aquaemixtae]